MDDLKIEELQEITETIILNTIEAIIKHNNKAADMIKSGNYTKEDVADFHKKLLNLIHILYPSLDVARKIVADKNPEYLYILDFVEKTYKECEE